MPDIEFVNSPKSEEKRLEFTRKIMRSGFYHKHGFVIVAELNKQLEPQVQVVCPRVIKYVPIAVTDYQRQWGRVQVEFWAELARYFPGMRKFWERVEVRVTRYGTVATGDWMRGKTRIYYLRQDAGVEALAGMIVNNALLVGREKFGITWSKREALMDFVMTRPGMRKLFPKYEPVFAQLSRVPKKIRNESEAYVRSLGIMPVKQELERVGAKIWIKGSEVGRELTKREKKVLGILIDHKEDLVTYDELADALWGVGEFKTYWAINKQVERLRAKLDKLGIAGERIETVRGQGYILS